MRHRVMGRSLGRDKGHAKALRKNLIADLICHEEILTTQAKAKMLRPAVEKMITLAKRGLAKGAQDPAREVHARRLAASRLPRYREVRGEDGILERVDVVKKLFEDIAPRYESRPGGYSRLIKIGKRPGDNADMAMLLLVDDE